MSTGEIHNKNNLDLTMLRDMYKIRFCSCGICDRLNTVLSYTPATEGKWEALKVFLEEESTLCSFLLAVYEDTRGTLCRWNVCYGCIQEVYVPEKPILEEINNPVDITKLIVEENREQTANCSRHGAFLEPFCIGDPPKLMCVKSSFGINSKELTLCPLVLSPQESRLRGECLSQFAFIPNSRRWNSTVSYRVVYDVTPTPIQLQDEEGKMYFYILRRITKPNLRAHTLTDLLSSSQWKLNVWMLQHNIMGTSNNGIGATGEQIVGNTSARQVLSTGNDAFMSRWDKQLEDFSEREGENGSEKEMKKGKKEKGKHGVRNKKGKRKEQNWNTGTKRKREKGDQRGDPLYQPQDEECNGQDEGDNLNDPSFYPAPFIHQNFIYEEEVLRAERNEQKREKKWNEKLDERPITARQQQITTFFSPIKSIPSFLANPDIYEEKSGHSAFKTSFDTTYEPNDSMEYRTPLLRASSFSTKGTSISEVKKKKQGLQEICQLLKDNNFPLIRPSLKGNPQLSLQTDIDNCARRRISLQVTVDIDSIDVITISLAGTAFQNSNASIFLGWHKSYAREDEVRKKNNGFIRFETAYSESYPGRYFGSDVVINARDGTRFGTYDGDAQLTDPVQIQVGEINLSLPYPMKLYAIVPSKPLLYFLRGSGALIELFDKHAYPEQRRGNSVSVRTRLSQLVWYMTTSALLFFASIGTRDGSSQGIWSRSACCAFMSVDSAMQEMHDRRQGHLSDFNAAHVLSSGSLTTALCLFARHQRALEQHAEVPYNLQVEELKAVGNYKISECLLDTVNPKLLAVLKADIGSNTCLQWFKDLWSSEKHGLGNLLAFRSDESRRGKNAFPSAESNIEACKRGSLVLEDMLPLTAVVLRGTVHGTKLPAYTAQQFKDVTLRLMQSFNPNAFKDGIIDVAYVFNGPSEENLSVHLKKSALSQIEMEDFRTTNILTPIGCEKTNKELGSYLTSGPGYPVFVGFSTTRGMCGQARSGISYSGPRKIKAYSTKWRGDSYRGRTIYSTSSARNVLKVLSNFRTLHRMIVNSSKDGGRQLKKTLDELMADKETVTHNISFRAKQLETFQNTAGVRVEYSCFFDPNFHFSEEPWNLLKMQDERFNMEQTRFNEVLAENPKYFPWWMKISVPCEDEDENPLAFLSGNILYEFGTLLERRALNLGVEIFVRSSSLLADMEMSKLQLSKHSCFMDSILPVLQNTETAAKFTCILSTALYKLSNRQVENFLCQRNNAVPTVLDSWMFSTGVSASYWYCGLPFVILSRLCNYPVFKCGFTLHGGNENNLTISEQEVPFLTALDDRMLPQSLRYGTNIRSFHVRVLKLMGSVCDGRDDTILMWVTRLLEPLFRGNPSVQFNNVSLVSIISFRIGAFLVKMLMADLAQTMLQVATMSSVVEQDWYEKKFGRTTTVKDILELSEKSRKSEMWSEHYRLDASCGEAAHGVVDSVKEGMNMLDSVFRFQLRPVRVRNGLKWENQTLPLDRDDTISDSGFINMLLHSVLESKKNRKPKNNANWLSLITLEATKTVFRYKGEEREFFKFCDPLCRAIRSCMRSAGFGNLSPAFRNERFCSFDSENSLWGPELLFTKMRFTNPSRQIGLRLFRPVLEDTAETCNAKIRSIYVILSEITKRRRKVMITSDEWNRLTDKYEDHSEQFWSMPQIEEEIFSAIQARFDAVKIEKGLINLDLDWAKGVVRNLIQIRKALLDEGMCCGIVDKKITHFRDLPVKPSKSQAISTPWGSLYMKAEKVYKKKSRVGQAGQIFDSQFPLLFKTKTRRGIETDFDANNESNLSLNECLPEVSVEDVYHLFREKSNEDLLQRRGHWRLAPTRMIAKLLLRVLR